MTVLEAVAPAHLWVPPGRKGSYLDEVGEIAEMIGRPLDASQRVAVDAINSYGPAGKWHTLESAVCMPRQNGKTGGIILPTVITDLLLWPDDTDRVAWTAHRMKTSRETFEDVKRLIDTSAEFSRRVRRISETNGEESVQFVNGSQLDFIARAAGGGRGLGGRTVVIDEALYFTSSAAGDLLPILAARPNPRVLYGSSACKVESTQLRALRDRGRAGGDPSLAWIEWCAAGSLEEPGCSEPGCAHIYGVLGCVLDDEQLWRAANPAMATGRVGIMFMRAMRRSLVPLEFAREFLGWHEEAGSGTDGFPAGSWAACRDPESAPEGAVTFALEVSLDRSVSTFGAAGRRADGLAHVEIVDRRAGTGWVLDRAVELYERWGRPIVVDPRSPGGSMLDPLARRGVEVVTPTGPEIVAACGSIHDLVKNQGLRHRGQHDLDAAANGAARLVVGDGAWRFSRKTSNDDVTALYSVVLALIGIDDTGPNIW